MQTPADNLKMSLKFSTLQTCHKHCMNVCNCGDVEAIFTWGTLLVIHVWIYNCGDVEGKLWSADDNETPRM